MWLSMRTSLSVEGGSVCASATKPIGRRTERVEPGTSAGRQRIRPVTWITWQTDDNSMHSLHTRPFLQDKIRIGRKFESVDTLQGSYAAQDEGNNSNIKRNSEI